MKYRFVFWISTLAIVLAWQTPAVAQDLKKGFKQLAKANYAQAHQIFESILRQDACQPLANYGLALMYSGQTSTGFDRWRAFEYIQNVPDRLVAADREILQKYTPHWEQVPPIRALIYDSLYAYWHAQVLAQDRTELYEHFLEACANTRWAPVVASAYHQRVFTEVCALDEPNAYEWFIQSFPEAEPVIQAKQERYRWAYAEACLSNKLSAYQDFVRQYPDAPQVAEAMERIALKQKYNKAFLLGKTYPAAHPLFVRVRAEHTPKAEMYMHREAYEAFSRMYEAALRDGVKLSIISGMRTFEQQAMIWNYKWSKLKGDGISRAQNIMVYSSMPGISRHHWGTDVDLNHLTNSYFDKGEGKKVYDWLLRHAREFGFYQVFDGHERAYAEERWHWSYMPVADVCLQEYLSEISYDDLRGFVGEELAPQLRVIERYVKGEGLRTE